ncbi:hypothetical protein CPC16_009431, partial [Podila verticillata]
MLSIWIQFLTDTNTPFATTPSDAHRLLRHGLFGARPVSQKLSHSSALALFLQCLICSSLQLDLHLENTELQDTRDVSLIAEATG